MFNVIYFTDTNKFIKSTFRCERLDYMIETLKRAGIKEAFIYNDDNSITYEYEYEKGFVQ